MLLGYLMNAAIEQQCEKYIKENGVDKEVEAKIAKIWKDKGQDRPAYQGDVPEGNDGLGLMLLGVTGDQVLQVDVYEKIKVHTLSQVRGTVQADILKEDQAQNTCIFSTEFALRMMGDVQQYFIDEILPNTDVLVAVIGRKVVGFIAASRDSIDEIYVHTDHQGQGIGSKSLTWAQEISNGKLELYTFERNKKSQQFYESKGFKVTERNKTEAWMLDDIKYEWVRA